MGVFGKFAIFVVVEMSQYGISTPETSVRNYLILGTIVINVLFALLAFSLLV